MRVHARGDISNTSGRCRAFSPSRDLRGDTKVHFGRVFPLLGITFTRFSTYFLLSRASLPPLPLAPRRQDGMRFVNCLVCATSTCQQCREIRERGRKGRDNGHRFLKSPRNEKPGRRSVNTLYLLSALTITNLRSSAQDERRAMAIEMAI